MDLKLIKIVPSNLEVFENLAQAYEAEFSSLTGQMPNKMGKFKIDVPPFLPYCGYLLLYQNIPVGFSVVDVTYKVRLKT